MSIVEGIKIEQTKIEQTKTKEINKTNNQNINIYRYKFTDELTEEMYKFSKVHEYDNRKDYKEAWLKWVDDNEIIVFNEVRRLTNLNYEGDILDKMFKSSRYYFRKKSTVKKEPTKRREYTSVKKEFLQAMDSHISISVKDNHYKPSSGFDDFCNKNVECIKQEVENMSQNGQTENEIKNKMKKTYKNRYFLFIQSKK
jgi:hypothetical protein